MFAFKYLMSNKSKMSNKSFGIQKYYFLLILPQFLEFCSFKILCENSIFIYI